MAHFVPMNRATTDRIRFSSAAANSVDLLNKLSGTTPEQILQERGPSAALLAENFSSFGLTISKCKAVEVAPDGSIIRFIVT